MGEAAEAKELALRRGRRRKLAAALGLSKDAVHRVWREAGLKPHRLERYMASDDPDFERSEG